MNAIATDTNEQGQPPTLPIVVAEGLVKRYGTFTAVAGIDFTIPRGTCVGFLGPNGAGKTTTVKMIYCVSPVTEGRLTVMGMDVMSNARRIKSQVGVVPQDDNLDPDFTVRENLLVFSRYFGMARPRATARADTLISFMKLDAKRDAMVDDLSGGLKRRLTIARALLNEPMILVLDEPTTGLDPQARRMIWDKIRSLRQRGITIILTTHYMEEATQLCDEVMIMDAGGIVARGGPEELVRRYGDGEEVLEVTGSPATLETLQHDLCEHHNAGTLYCEPVVDGVQIFCEDCRAIESELMAHYELRTRMIRLTNLEDVFLKLTGRRLND